MNTFGVTLAVNLIISRTYKSGREDLNLRPHDPEPCALAKLSYAPSACRISISDGGDSVNSINSWCDLEFGCGSCSIWVRVQAGVGDLGRAAPGASEPWPCIGASRARGSQGRSQRRGGRRSASARLERALRVRHRGLEAGRGMSRTAGDAERGDSKPETKPGRKGRAGSRGRSPRRGRVVPEAEVAEFAASRGGEDHWRG
jgi:hypothetical protein